MRAEQEALDKEAKQARERVEAQASALKNMESRRNSKTDENSALAVRIVQLKKDIAAAEGEWRVANLARARAAAEALETRERAEAKISAQAKTLAEVKGRLRSEARARYALQDRVDRLTSKNAVLKEVMSTDRKDSRKTIEAQKELMKVGTAVLRLEASAVRENELRKGATPANSGAEASLPRENSALGCTVGHKDADNTDNVATTKGARAPVGTCPRDPSVTMGGRHSGGRSWFHKQRPAGNNTVITASVAESNQGRSKRWIKLKKHKPSCQGMPSEVSIECNHYHSATTQAAVSPGGALPDSLSKTEVKNNHGRNEPSTNTENASSNKETKLSKTRSTKSFKSAYSDLVESVDPSVTDASGATSCTSSSDFSDETSFEDAGGMPGSGTVWGLFGYSKPMSSNSTLDH